MSKLGSIIAYWRSPTVKLGPVQLRLYWGKRGPSLNIRKRSK